MILSDRLIKLHNIMDPCHPRTVFRGKSYGLSSCGYDVRCDIESMDDWADYNQVFTPDGDGIALDPSTSILLGIMEHFSIPPGVVGFIKDKSTWSRQGLFTPQAVLEPGWKGFLGLRMYNLGDEPVTIVHGEAIAQVIFQWIDGVPENTYTGKYQGATRGDLGPRFEG